jgi:hypothetical protein
MSMQGLAAGHYQRWQTIVRCTQPEPRRLLQLNQKTLKKAVSHNLFWVHSVSTKGWSPVKDSSLGKNPIT